MKKIFVMAALVAATTMNAENVNAEANDTIVVIDNSRDDEVINEFLATGEEFDAKSNKAATYVDGTTAIAGEKSRPIKLDARQQRGWFLGASGSLTGTLGSNAMWGPKIAVTGGYEGNKWGAYASLGMMKIKPNEQSDFQGNIKAFEASFVLNRSIKQWNDHHTRLAWYGEANFRTAFDRQNLGTYESVNVEETETEIITTRESGWRAYEVKPFMFGAETGLELSHQLYKKPWAFYGKAGVGFTSQIAGKESVNGSADGIGYKPTFELEIGVRFYLHGKIKNVKAQNMIRHY